jgi:hypothetical protein
VHVLKVVLEIRMANFRAECVYEHEHEHEIEHGHGHKHSCS